VDFDLHGRPPFVPPPLLELDEWPPCSLGLDLHQENFQIEMALRLEFKTSNNQAEYEALIAGLLLARDMGVDNVICKSDSQLTVGHI